MGDDEMYGSNGFATYRVEGGTPILNLVSQTPLERCCGVQETEMHKVDEHPDQTLSVPVIRTHQGLNLVQRPGATLLVENGGNEWEL